MDFFFPPLLKPTEILDHYNIDAMFLWRPSRKRIRSTMSSALSFPERIFEIFLRSVRLNFCPSKAKFAITKETISFLLNTGRCVLCSIMVINSLRRRLLSIFYYTLTNKTRLFCLNSSRKFRENHFLMFRRFTFLLQLRLQKEL